MNTTLLLWFAIQFAAPLISAASVEGNAINVYSTPLTVLHFANPQDCDDALKRIEKQSQLRGVCVKGTKPL